MNRLTTAQLCLLRCLEKRPMEATLLPIFLNRNGTTEAEWNQLTTAGYVQRQERDIVMTKEGRQAYRKGKVGRYF